MIIVKPVAITEALLFATNVAEADYAAWSNATAYAIADRVIYQHRIYEALTNNTNKQPDTSPLDWLDVGATNRYRMFDGIVDAPTTNSAQIDVTLRTGTLVNAVALFNVAASYVQVQVDDPVDGIVYDQTIYLDDYSAITSWYAYFFELVGERRTDIVFTDLPNYPAADIRILIDNGAGVASCGECVVGAQKTLGVLNFGTSVSIKDYSRKDEDEFGNTIIVQRRFAKTAEYDVTVNTPEISSVQRALAALRATPAVYIGNGDREETIVYGFYKSFRIVISNPILSPCAIQVEGLV